MITTASRNTIVAVLAALALAIFGLSATFADRGESQAPEWFAPIAEYYDNNPAITPETDFAELHFGGLDE